MSDKIKPSEVSQMLFEQLKGISGEQKFDEIGTVLEVSDGVARIYGLRNAEANELLQFDNGTMAIVMTKARVRANAFFILFSPFFLFFNRRYQRGHGG